MERWERRKGRGGAAYNFDGRLRFDRRMSKDIDIDVLQPKSRAFISHLNFLRYLDFDTEWFHSLTLVWTALCGCVLVRYGGR